MSRFRWALVAMALAALSLAASHLPEPPTADESVRWNNLGVAYMNQQRTEQALELFERAFKMNPSLDVARLNQGIALLNLQRYQLAREILLEIAQQDPQNTRAWYNLGLLYKNMGEAEAALEVFGKATELAPTDADVH
ncbi:MAG: tetratricopeptide repeat protein, partial [Candidatus Acidiferrales bacterium]